MCATCHEYRRPADTLHTTQGAGDCASCHAIKSATQTDWTGGTFSHAPKPTTCAGCHTADKPAAAVRGTGVSTDGRTYQNDYLHSLVTGDCVACHREQSATQTDWTGGTYSHSPVPAKCTTCHAVTKPAAGATSFDHSLPGLGECSSCHAFAGKKWTGASAVPSSVILTPPTGKNWPSITAPHPVIDTAKAGLTCASCHGANTGARIIDYDHAKPVTGSQVRLLSLHGADGDFGQRRNQESREHQQHQGLQRVRVPQAEGLPDLECHSQDVFWWRMGRTVTPSKHREQ